MIELYEKILNEQGLTGGFLEIYEGKDFKAEIDMEKWKITAVYPSFYNEKKVKIILRDMILHEISHWKLCPYDILKAYELVDTAYPYFRNLDDALYITNAFEDLIVNSWNAYKNPPYEGIIEFYKNEVKKGYDSFYYFFVILNLKLMDKENLITVLIPQKYRKKVKILKKDANDLLKEWKLPSEKEEKIEFLINSSHWIKMLKVFIQKAKKYFRSKKHNLSVFEPYFEEKVREGEEIMRYIEYSSKKGKKVSFMNNFDFLDRYYESLTPYIEIKAEDVNNFEIPLIRYGKEEFDVNNHQFHEINFRRIFYDKNSPFKNNINFYVSPFKQGLRVPSGDKKFFPDLMIVLDTSGSMTAGRAEPFLNWGNKYHNALISIYAILKYLKRKRIAHMIRYSLVCFSSGTKTTGWLYYHELNKLKRMLFTPEQESTHLKTRIIKELLRNRRVMFILITDSEIYNFNKIKKELIDILDKNYSFFFQMGMERGQGFKHIAERVNYIIVKNPSDLVRAVIDVTGRVYDNI